LVKAGRESVVRKLFRKGYIETLLFIHKKGEVRFADVRKFLHLKSGGPTGFRT